MKNLIILGLFLILAASATGTSTGVSATWMSQAGLVLLLGALAIFAGTKHLKTQHTAWKILKVTSFGLMLLITLGSFYTTWGTHPLGTLIALAGIAWVIYCTRKIGLSML